MKRMTTIAFAVSALLVAGSAMAQTAPPPTQTAPPPAGQTVKPTPTPQATPTMTPPPTPKPTPPPEPFPPDAKLGFIDLQRVVAESKLGKQGQEAMKSLNDKLSTALANKNKEILALTERIKTQQNVVADSVLQSLGRDLEKAQREGKFMQDDAQVQVGQLNEQLMGNFQAQVLPVVEALRKEKGLWIIFALGESSNIAAANAGLDLSLEVIKRLDAITK